ncbi:MAG: hypothetical protein ACFFDT_20110 [Candidatus Hodarchaeota archaeon]
MNVHVHVVATGIIVFLLEMFNPLTQLELSCIIGGSIGLDLDFLIAKNNHRKMPTHFPLLWIPVILVGVLYYPLFCLGFGALVHLLLDCFDWGIYLFAPFSKILCFPFVNNPQETSLNLAEYIKRIYISPVPLFLEILVTISFFVLFLFNIHTLILFFGIYCAVAAITFLYVFWLNDFLANLNTYSFLKQQDESR